jgi:phosphoribosylaminoimidazolecarboxamide formyltransferase/IMP cyclohydrolase
LISISRALLSAYDKEGLPELAKTLVSLNVELVSSGGTAALLREHGFQVKEVSDLTGFPEMLGGRLKTLHPKVLGGVLYRRDSNQDKAEVEQHGLIPFDMVVVDFYPFERAARAGAAMSDAEKTELIDIGGPCMVRAAAKNWAHVLVLTHQSQYEEAAAQLKKGDGKIDPQFSRAMAAEAFRKTCLYDLLISHELGAPTAEKFPFSYVRGFRQKAQLRYGENPHQRAALYVDPAAASGVAVADPLHGKALSFNNLWDLQAAWDAVGEFDGPACVVVKHRNACGVAVAADAATAFMRARDADSLSAFGGVVAFNRQVDEAASEALTSSFFECVVAPSYDAAALEQLKTKKNLRLLEVRRAAGERAGVLERPLAGGLLLQEEDAPGVMPEMSPVTKKVPTSSELEDLKFAWAVAKHVMSNAVVLARDGVTIGIGSGQTSRIDALDVAIMKATRAGAAVRGAVMASDGFFPFRDCVDRAHEVGVTAVVEPGGSIRDKESIEAAESHGMALLFTGKRCFKH